MYKIITLERAITMMLESFEWYENQLIGLGDDFLNDVNNCINKIEKNPTFYGFIEKKYRRINLKRFPFVIIYEVINTDIVIYAVFHTSKNPNKRIRDLL